REALRLKKDYANAHYSLGLALRDKGRLDEAIAEWREALRLNKDDGEAHNALAWLLATSPQPRLRDPARAVKHAERAVALEPQNVDAWNTLASISTVLSSPTIFRGVGPSGQANRRTRSLLPNQGMAVG